MKTVLGALAALLALLAVNALATDAETEPAEATVPGGELLSLRGGELQAVESGPPGGDPIVLIHCFTCATDWWDAMTPRLARSHRVVAVDLLGHGGSEKPTSGYSVENQANLVAEALGRLGVRDATVVGHSLGGTVAVALAESAPAVVERLVIVDTPSSDEDEADLGLIARLAFTPVIGQALWRVKPDFSVRDGLEVAFAPGYEVPDAFVEDVKRMNYSAYRDSPDGFDDFAGETPLADRVAGTGKPLMVIMGAEERIVSDPGAALRSYREVLPETRTELVQGAGHSPNVERPALTAALVLDFIADTPMPEREKTAANRGKRGGGMQGGLQNRDAVRGPS